MSLSPLWKGGELAPVVVHNETKDAAMLQSITHEAPPTNPNDTEDSRRRRIRDLNDRMRQNLSRFTVTAGVQSLGHAAIHAIAQMVRTFTEFNEDNDPWGEHDFGAFDFQGHKIFWKIDYYSPDLKHGSPDPTDPTVTCRVLTVMLASEY